METFALERPIIVLYNSNRGRVNNREPLYDMLCEFIDTDIYRFTQTLRIDFSVK